MEVQTPSRSESRGRTGFHTAFIEQTYFTAVSSILVVLSLVAFSDNLVTDRGQPSNRDPKFIVHGIFWLAWFSLFVVQITLAVGVGVILSTGYIFAVTHTGWQEMFVFARANRYVLEPILDRVAGHLERSV